MDKETAEYFEEIVAIGCNPKLTCNWMIGELSRVTKEKDVSIRNLNVSAEHLAQLINLLEKKTISSGVGKKVVEEMLSSGKSPQVIVEEQNLAQVSDEGELEKMVEELIANNPDQVEQYRSGKTKIISFFIGQMMKATKGKSNPEVLNKLLREKLSN